MARITVVTLRAEVDRINDCLARDGIRERLVVGGRYGYQAVDEYTVDADGKRIGSWVNRTVCAGTSRECVDGAWAHCNALTINALRSGLAGWGACINGAN